MKILTTFEIKKVKQSIDIIKEETQQNKIKIALAEMLKNEVFLYLIKKNKYTPKLKTIKEGSINFYNPKIKSKNVSSVEYNNIK